MIVLFTGLIAFMIPVAGQSSQIPLVSEEVQLFTAEIQKDDIPQDVIKTINLDFDKRNQFTWSKLPHQLKEFGWVYEIGDTDTPINSYKVRIKTNARVLSGSYDAEGNLVETHERSKDIAVPRYVMEALYSSPYKDWKIVGNKEIVNFYNLSDNSLATQNFKLKLEKDNKRKTLAFNYEVNSGRLEARLIR